MDPSAFAKPAFPVTIRVDGMLGDGKLIAPGDHMRVSAGRRRLTFRYAGVNVSNPESVRYRYRLDNVDSDWSEPTALRKVDLHWGLRGMGRVPSLSVTQSRCLE